MSERNDDDMAGTSDGAERHDDPGAREGIVFTEEQREALAGLASENTYAKQSKWQTLRELPMKDKWPFFAQHFLGATVAIVAAVVAVIAFVVNFVTQPPDPLLYIAGVNMSQEYTEPMEALERRFVADEGLDSELVTYDANFTITETGVSGGMVDGSSRLFTMASVGQVNTIITDEETFRELCERGLTSALEEVLPADQIESFESAGITVDSGVKDAQGRSVAAQGTRSGPFRRMDGGRRPARRCGAVLLQRAGDRRGIPAGVRGIPRFRLISEVSGPDASGYWVPARSVGAGPSAIAGDGGLTESS